MALTSERCHRACSDGAVPLGYTSPTEFSLFLSVHLFVILCLQQENRQKDEPTKRENSLADASGQIRRGAVLKRVALPLAPLPGVPGRGGQECRIEPANLSDNSPHPIELLGIECVVA